MASDPIENPPYMLHKATGQARVRIDGKDKYLGKYGTPESYEKYARVVAEWQAGRSPAPPRRPAKRPSLTVRQLYDLFWKQRVESYYWKDGKPTSEQAVVRAALAPVLELYGSTPSGEFGPLQLKAARNRMIDLGVSRRVINRNVGRVRFMFRWAVSEELYPADRLVALESVAPLEANRSRAREKKKVRAVALDVVEKTLPHCTARVHAMVRLQLLSGARPGEVCGLTPGAIDRSDPGAWVYRPASHKTEHHERDRVVVFGPRAQTVLEPWLLRAPDSPCFQPIETIAAAEGKTIDVSARAGVRRPAIGKPYTAGAYRHAITKACLRAFPAPPDLDAKAAKAWHKAHHWHPNQLRHTAGTMIRSHEDLEAAQVVLGHSKPDTTLIYAERDLERAKALMRQIG